MNLKLILIKLKNLFWHKYWVIYEIFFRLFYSSDHLYSVDYAWAIKRDFRNKKLILEASNRLKIDNLEYIKVDLYNCKSITIYSGLSLNEIIQ